MVSDRALVTSIGILSMTMIEIYALNQGIDGSMLTIIVAGIGAAVGRFSTRKKG